MSTPNCKREFITVNGKRLDCAGDQYYMAKDGTVRFGSVAGKAAYDHDRITATYLKAAVVTVAGVALVHVLTK